MMDRVSSVKSDASPAERPRRDGLLERLNRFGGLLAAGIALAAVVILVVAVLNPPPAPEPMQPEPPVQPAPAAPPRPAVRQPAIALPTSPLAAGAEPLQDEARRTAADLQSRYPQLPEALHVAAMMHAQLRETEEAEQLWRRCVALAPKDERYAVNLATVAMERGDSELAVQTLQRLKDSGSKSHDVLHHLGIALNNLGRCEEAEKVLQEALELDPASAAFWLVLGQTQLKLNKAAESEASLLKAIDLGLESASIYFALANACARQGKDAEAKKHRERYAKLSASQPLEAQERFRVLSTAEARQTAVTILTEAAAVHASRQDTLEAERLLLRALALNPASSAACRALATLYQHAGMYPEERLVRRRLVEAEPHLLEHYINLAQVSVQLEEPESAEAVLKLAVAMTPDAAEPYTTLAQFYLEVGKTRQARWFAQEAVRRRPTADNYVLLASTCRLLGDDATAQAAYAKARELDPNRSDLP
jgi:tetratricopeptide (TPR) repeat protein